ncbi:hypothetical protein [Corynebacterium glucuronolyticum]|uniref:hypothetical protein n=1 Tax=Corynebacterium glucuronolyticum TaxID=39791 RepID=UPI00019C215B|nr:hypothetical protein [Corynebacterium glucuronolyticum]EEI27917.1 hypothetical protein HMPREF0294_0531 [Corynebacterium glucuronolyticum ATCC 51867]QRO81961.1 hypothetical protein I6J20_08775 [Corynebacterium glucuronolyticum]
MAKINEFTKDYPEHRWVEALVSGVLKKRWKEVAPVRYYCPKGCLLGFVYPVDILPDWLYREPLPIGELTDEGHIQAKSEVWSQGEKIQRIKPWSPWTPKHTHTRSNWFFMYRAITPMSDVIADPNDLGTMAVIQARSIREVREINFEEAVKMGEDVTDPKDVNITGERDRWEVVDLEYSRLFDAWEKRHGVEYMKVNDMSKFGYMNCKHIEVERSFDEVQADIQEGLSQKSKNFRQKILEGYQL